MLATSSKVALVSGNSHGPPLSLSQNPVDLCDLDTPESTNPSQDVEAMAAKTAPSGARHGLLMECAASSSPKGSQTLIDLDAYSRSPPRAPQTCVDSASYVHFFQKNATVATSSPSIYEAFPRYLQMDNLYTPSLLTPASPPSTYSNPNLGILAGNSRFMTDLARTGPYHLQLSTPPQNSPRNFNTSPRLPLMAPIVFRGQHSPDFRSMCEQIWRYNDQKTSLYMQERLKCCIPGEYEELVAAIFENAMPLMVHRFGNFLVQCMLQLAKLEDIAALAKRLEGHIAELSKNQFCCHVIQRLLDVSSVVIQATIAAELLEDVVETMQSPSGSHVWQKLLHLPWKYGLPPITAHANNAVHLPPNQRGWLTIAETEAGCATIKSFLGVSTAGPERQQCLDEILGAFNSLMLDPVGSVLAARVAMIAASRSRAVNIIFSNAYRYAMHPVASGVLVTLLDFKIPSFPSRLDGALVPRLPELYNSPYGRHVIAALNLSRPRK